MSWEHPPDELLRDFATGTLATPEAVEIALHLDGCVECAARETLLDPLAVAWSQVADPTPPADLALDILDKASAPPTSTPEPAIAAALIALATMVLVVGGSPTGIIARGAARLKATVTAVTTLLQHADGGAAGGLWFALAILLLIMSVASVRHLEKSR